MPVGEAYRRQAALLVGILPFVAAEKCFALKGGTAINLFIRDLPRISVDLDLTYLPVADRDASLTAIDAAMRRIAAAIAQGIRGARADAVAPRGENRITRLIVRADGVQVQIEVTPVSYGAASTNRRFAAFRRGSRRNSASRKSKSCLLRTSMAARSWLRSIGSTRAIFLTFAICWRTRGSATKRGGPSSSI